MEVRVFSRLQAEALPWHSGQAFISITNPRQKAAHLPEGASVLRLGFYDTEAHLPGWPGLSCAQAQEVIAFLEALPSGVTELIVHCEFGASRSPAVAQFAAAWFQAPVFFETAGADGVLPNRFVRSTLRRQLGWYAARRPRLWLRALRMLLKEHLAVQEVTAPRRPEELQALHRRHDAAVQDELRAMRQVDRDD